MESTRCRPGVAAVVCLARTGAGRAATLDHIVQRVFSLGWPVASRALILLCFGHAWPRSSMADGGMPARPIPVIWEVARRAVLRIARSGTTQALPERIHACT